MELNLATKRMEHVSANLKCQDPNVMLVRMNPMVTFQTVQLVQAAKPKEQNHATKKLDYVSVNLM